MLENLKISISSDLKIKIKGIKMWIKIIDTNKIVFAKNVVEFGILTFNKDFEYVIGETK